MPANRRDHQAHRRAAKAVPVQVLVKVKGLGEGRGPVLTADQQLAAGSGQNSVGYVDFPGSEAFKAGGDELAVKVDMGVPTEAAETEKDPFAFPFFRQGDFTSEPAVMILLIPRPVKEFWKGVGFPAVQGSGVGARRGFHGFPTVVEG